MDLSPPMSNTPDLAGSYNTPVYDPAAIKRRELRFTNCIVQYPCIIMWSMGIIVILLTVLDFAVLKFSIVGDRPSGPRGDVTTLRHDAWERLKSAIVNEEEEEERQKKLRQPMRSKTGQRISFIYESKNDPPNVFTPPNIVSMFEAENILVGADDFTDWCVLRNENKTEGDWQHVCKAPTSAPMLLQATWQLLQREATPPLLEAVRTLSKSCCVDYSSQPKTAAIPADTIAALQNPVVFGWVSNPEFRFGFPSTPTQSNPASWSALCETVSVCDVLKPLVSVSPTTFKAICEPLKFSGDHEAAVRDACFYTVMAEIQQNTPTVSTFKTQAEVELALKYFVYAFSISPGLLTSFLGKEFCYEHYVKCAEGKTNHLTSAVTSSVVEYGFPLEGYLNDKIDDAEQYQKWSKWAKQFLTPLRETVKSIEGIDVLYFASQLTFEELMQVLMRDSLLALGSIVFVFLYVQIHTRSWFLALLGMIQIVMPFPLAYVVYKGVFRITSFFSLSTLSLYIVLAIGADDLFVFYDAWRKSQFAPDPEVVYLKGRMAWAWKNAAVAMLITSVTTMTAFLANLTSPLLEVSTFGVFSALLVGIDYLLVISFFAAAVAYYHKKWEVRGGCCCCCMKPPLPGVTVTPMELDDVVPTQYTADSHKGQKQPVKIWVKILLGVGVVLYLLGYLVLVASRLPFQLPLLVFIVGLVLVDIAINSFPVNAGKQSRLQIFMETTVANVICSWKKFLVLIPLLLFTAVMAYFASTIGPTEQSAQFLPNWHPMQRFFTSLQTDFKISDRSESPAVRVMWGLNVDKPLDTSGTSKWNLTDTGTLVFQDPPPPFATATMQQHIFDFCKAAQEATTGEGDEKTFLVRPLLGDDDANCFIRGFWKYAETKGIATPVPEAQFHSLLHQFVMEIEVSRTAARNRIQPHEEYDTHLFFDSKQQLVAAYATFNTTLKSLGNPYDDLKVLHDAWEKFTTEQNVKMTNGGGIQTSGDWVWMKTQKAYMSGAILGTVLSICFAFVVILLFTLNLLIAIFALIEIVAVVACIIGLMACFGWDLGVIESICVTVLVGLAVDYVVHLAHAYTESEKPTRDEKVREALASMGGTVLGGMMTSVGASMLLLATWLQFFMKFGVFMFLTISLSWIFTMGLFLPLCALIGPQGNFLSLKPFVNRLFRRKPKDITHINGSPPPPDAPTNFGGNGVPDVEYTDHQPNYDNPVYSNDGNAHDTYPQQPAVDGYGYGSNVTGVGGEGYPADSGYAGYDERQQQPGGYTDKLVIDHTGVAPQY